jgi:hypothetical protein
VQKAPIPALSARHVQMMLGSAGSRYRANRTSFGIRFALSLSMILRCIMAITGFLLLVAMGAFLLVVPGMIAIGIAVVTVVTALVFVLGVQVGARALPKSEIIQDF